MTKASTDAPPELCPKCGQVHVPGTCPAPSTRGLSSETIVRAFPAQPATTSAQPTVAPPTVAPPTMASPVTPPPGWPNPGEPSVTGPGVPPPQFSITGPGILPNRATPLPTQAAPAVVVPAPRTPVPQPTVAAPLVTPSPVIPPAVTRQPTPQPVSTKPPRPESMTPTSAQPITPAPTRGANEDPNIGQLVGSFQITRALGRGGMGSVYAAEHPVIGSKVAIKFLHQALAGNDELVRRFYDEARAVNLIGHDNIVSIFDLNVLPPNRYYIVMEYLEGQTLSALLGQGQLDKRKSTDILLQLCDALAAAHSRGVVHRDLKPENIFLVRKGAKEHFVKLVDFGIAKLRDNAQRESMHTQAGVLVGTPEYMSPEQCDHREVDARSDIYALGVMAYRLLVGRLPFVDGSVARLMMAHLEVAPPPPRQLNPTLSSAWEGAILKALAKEPKDRFQSAQEFAEAIRLAEAAPPTGGRPAVMPGATPVPAPSPDQPRHAAGFEVELLNPGPTRPLRAADISRGGAFLCTTGVLPPLFSRVKLGLARQRGGRLELSAEVVRHVLPHEAKAWNMEPGFAVQFADLSAPQKTALSEFVADLPKAKLAPTPVPQVADDPMGSEVLDYFRQRLAANHYELLGAAPDADFQEIRARARTLEERLDALNGRPLSKEQVAQVVAVRERVKLAASVLNSPGPRAEYDAQRGNFRGVARCVSAGLKEADLANKHKVFLKERPGLEARIQQHLGRIKLAKGRGNEPAALREYEVALGLDPLNADLHKGYWALKRQVEGGA